MLDVIERMVMRFHGTNPDNPTGKLVASGLVQQSTDGMLAALRELQAYLAEQVDHMSDHSPSLQPSEVIGHLISRHENARKSGAGGDVIP